MYRFVLVLTLIAGCSHATPVAAPTSTPAAARISPELAATPMSADALRTYFQARFPKAVAAGQVELAFGAANVSDEVIAEAAILGIHTIGELEAVVPADFEEKGFGANAVAGTSGTTIAGVMRDIFIIHDARTYVAKAWRNAWTASGPQDFPAPVAYGVDMKILEEGGMFGESDDSDVEDEGYDPCAGD